MKLLITGNATCANRGDAAIFRGLLNEIETTHSEANLICCSRHPIASSVVLGRQLEPDWIYQSQLVSGSSLRKAKNLITQNLKHDRARWSQTGSVLGRVFGQPTLADEFADRVADVDAVLHVGGSFFVDLYGVRQMDVIMACARLGKPVYLAGHSMGPYRIPRVKKFAEAFLPTVKQIYLREKASQPMLDELDVQLTNVDDGSDTAWLMPASVISPVFAAELGESDKPLVAVTVRKLAPFDKRLGITQAEYEQKLATLLDTLVDRGFHIVGVSMCTGLGGYAHDDRLIAESVRKRLKDPRSMTVLWNEYNDLEVGGILQQCKLLIGTRLHSVILALRYCTPAIALFYEHKSEGVLKQLSLGDWSVRLQDVDATKTQQLAFGILDDHTAAQARVTAAVDNEQQNAREMIGKIMSDISQGVQS